MSTHDRVAFARTRHKRGNKRSCKACGEQWPCSVAVVLDELDRARAENARLRQKPSMPAPLRRPRLPVRRHDGSRSWTLGQVLGHIRYVRRQAERAEEFLGAVFGRLLEDVDDALSSPPIEGGGSPTHEADGSRTGRVPGQALQHERTRIRRQADGTLMRDPVTGEPLTHSSWVTDPILSSGSKLMRGLEHAGDGIAEVAAQADFLHGLSPADAKRLVTPQPGECENSNCGRWVENTKVDRLIIFSKDGKLRCSPCDRHVRRYGEERPRHLCHPGEAEAS